MFRALLLVKDGEQAALTETEMDDAALMPGEVTIAVSYSTVNYKDGLAVTGRAPVVRRFPMIPGIDLAGTVLSDDTGALKRGTRVVVNGWGMGETHFGGYAGRARVKAGWPVILPDALSATDAMAIGTAGYTAMLCVTKLEQAGLKPSSGPVLVTGAAGGVGSVAIAILAQLGFTVIASTGRPDEEAYLKGLGASELIARAELSGDPKPLGKERWAGVVDSVGSKTLANAIASTRYGGAVAACGLAQGMELPGSVAPFILRGVSLLGVDSVMAPKPVREAAWQRLATDLPREKLAAMTREIGLSDVQQAAGDILAGKVRGRLVVRVSG